jgi:hypothetical protein
MRSSNPSWINPRPRPHDAVDDSGNGAVIRRARRERCGNWRARAMTGKVDTGSRENDGGREQDSGAEQVAEDDFDAVIVPRLWVAAGAAVGRALGGGHQIFPQNPL